MFYYFFVILSGGVGCLEISCVDSQNKTRSSAFFSAALFVVINIARETKEELVDDDEPRVNVEDTVNYNKGLRQIAGMRDMAA